MFLIPAFFALISAKAAKPLAIAGLRPEGLSLAWVLAWLAITLVIGFRYQVGGDWGNYFNYLYGVRGLDLERVLTKSDPGYQVLNWLSVQMDWDIFGVNTICGAIFATGLVAFCRRQPLPWLALSVSIPYLLIVVAMGYSRQGVALGLAMLGLVGLSNRSTLRFVIWISLAATFHKSAVVLLPIGALAAAKNRYWTLVWVGLTSAVVYNQMLEKDVDSLYVGYVQAQYQSQGALVRLLMNACPAVVLLFWRSRFQFEKGEERLWLWFAAISLLLLGLLMVSPSSTAVDRVALYVLPLQIVVFSRLPGVFGDQGKHNFYPLPDVNSMLSNSYSFVVTRDVSSVTLAVLIYYAVVQTVWLSFGAMSFSWVPYKFYLLEPSF
jgi:hypothetical protein